MPPRKTRDEHLPNGSIIYWSRRQDQRVPVKCGICGDERSISASRPSQPDFTGLCHTCACAKRSDDEQLLNGSAIFWSRRCNGYVPVRCGICGKERIIKETNATRQNFAGVCRSCAAGERTSDETLQNGSVVYWSRRKGQRVPVLCGICECERIIHAANIHKPNFTGLCRKCAHTGPNSTTWQGGRITKRGYIYVRVYPDHPFFAAMASHAGYIAEHRLVMAESLGRPLQDTEIVHHKNGIKADNRIENLELFVSQREYATERQRRNPHPGYKPVVPDDGLVVKPDRNRVAEIMNLLRKLAGLEE